MARKQKSSPFATLLGLALLIGIPYGMVKSCTGETATAASTPIVTTSPAVPTTSTPVPYTPAPTYAPAPSYTPPSETYAAPSSEPEADVPNPDLPGHAPSPHVHVSRHGHVHFHL